MAYTFPQGSGLLHGHQIQNQLQNNYIPFKMYRLGMEDGNHRSLNNKQQ